MVALFALWKEKTSIVKPEPSRFDRYTLVSPEARQKLRTSLEVSGVEYEMQETEDHGVGEKFFNLYILVVRRTSPTLKQRLTDGNQ